MKKDEIAEAIYAVRNSLDNAQVGVSGHRVGAAVIAENEWGHRKVFGGCNIELSNANGFHAERVALLKALSEGYTDIFAVFVSSSHPEQRAALCGYCRQDFMYVNPNCEIYVLDTDWSVKLKVKLINTLKHPYLGKGKITKNKGE